MAKENRSWGYDRIVGALANLGYQVSDQTVGNVLRRHDIPPAPERKRTTRWAEFIRTHLAVLAGTDFFTVEVLKAPGTGDLLCALLHPSGEPKGGDRRDHYDAAHLLHDHDAKYTASFLAIIESVHVKALQLPARSSNLNAYCERLVRSAKEECLSKLILFGERPLRRAMREYVAHYHTERNNQGKSNAHCFLQSRKFVVTKL